MQTQIDCEEVVQDVFCEIGFDSYVEDVFSVDGKCLSDKTCEAESPGGGRRSASSQRGVCRAPGIARGVHVGKYDSSMIALSCASCTTNGLVPVVRTTNDAFDVRRESG